ncbi:hypothetical protein DsansV1_C20g0164211 [Dioscorea sansibarensis]
MWINILLVNALMNKGRKISNFLKLKNLSGLIKSTKDAKALHICFKVEIFQYGSYEE